MDLQGLALCLKEKVSLSNLNIYNCLKPGVNLKSLAACVKQGIDLDSLDTYELFNKCLYKIARLNEQGMPLYEISKRV